MARVTLNIAGRDHDIACRDGDEDRFRALGASIDAKAREVARGMGGMTEARVLLFTALLLADELETLRATPPPPPPAPRIDPAALERLADRAEALAERLEREAHTS